MQDAKENKGKEKGKEKKRIKKAESNKLNKN